MSTITPFEYTTRSSSRFARFEWIQFLQDVVPTENNQCCHLSDFARFFHVSLIIIFFQETNSIFAEYPSCLSIFLKFASNENKIKIVWSVFWLMRCFYKFSLYQQMWASLSFKRYYLLTPWFERKEYFSETAWQITCAHFHYPICDWNDDHEDDHTLEPNRFLSWLFCHLRHIKKINGVQVT